MAITISGNGIVEANLADNAVTLAKMASGTDGEILTYDASGNPVAVSVGTDGQVLTSGGTGVAPAFETAAGYDNTPSFGVELSSHQSIPNATETKVAFDTEVWDTDSAFDNSTNYRFTVPSGEGGKYLFSYGGAMALTQDQILSFELWKNGSTAAKSRHRDFGMSTQTVSTIGSYMMDLSASDYVELYVYQSKGSTGDLLYSQGTHFSGFKLAGV